jgi:hypothetical protein
MVHVMASTVVQPEQAQAARTLLAGLATEARREPGCLAYKLFQRPDLPPHVAKTVAAGQTTFATAPEMLTYARVDVP